MPAEMNTAAIDHASNAAKPRVRPMAGYVGTYAVSYRGLSARMYSVHNDGKIAWWTVCDNNEKEICRGETGESALDRWTDSLDAAARLERVKARKPGKAVEFAGIKIWGTETINATVIPNRSIRVHGERNGKPVDITFEVGAFAEHGSFNLSYMGRIQSITAKTVTVDDHGRNKRLTIAQFAMLNRESTEVKERRNSEWCD